MTNVTYLREAGKGIEDPKKQKKDSNLNSDNNITF